MPRNTGHAKAREIHLDRVTVGKKAREFEPNRYHGLILLPLARFSKADETIDVKAIVSILSAAQVLRTLI